MAHVAPISHFMKTNSKSRSTTTHSGRVVAGCLSLGAFATALVAGLAADNPSEVILGRAIACLFGGYVVGLIVGSLCEFAIGEELTAYQAARPIPDSNVSVDDLVQEMMAAREGDTDSQDPEENSTMDSVEPLAVRPE